MQAVAESVFHVILREPAAEESHFIGESETLRCAQSDKNWNLQQPARRTTRELLYFVGSRVLTCLPPGRRMHNIEKTDLLNSLLEKNIYNLLN
jgi:hypothetical protein